MGLAAISVCKYYGATIYAAASKPKQDYLRKLGVDDIYNSRDKSWYAEVMRDTGGRGVDVVLNSLNGENLWLGMQALARGGRFLEIGKVDT